MNELSRNESVANTSEGRPFLSPVLTAMGSMRTRLPVATLGLLLGTCALLPSARADECGSDNDCKGDRVCFKGRCVNPETADELEAREVGDFDAAGPAEGEAAPPAQAPEPVSPPVITPSAVPIPDKGSVASYPNTEADVLLALDECWLVVRLDEEHASVTGVTVFIDEKPVGEAPWRGVVRSGVHEVRLEGNGYFSDTVATRIWPKRTRVLEMELLSRDGFDVGRLYLGIHYPLSFGRGFSGGNNRFVYTEYLGPGLILGVKIDDSTRGWWELGVLAGPYGGLQGTENFVEPEDRFFPEASHVSKDAYSSHAHIPLALQARRVWPLRTPYFYLGTEVAIGGTLIDPGFLAALRAGPSFVLNDWIEIRLDIVGIQLLRARLNVQEYYNVFDYQDGGRSHETFDSALWITVITYSFSASFVLRF